MWSSVRLPAAHLASEGLLQATVGNGLTLLTPPVLETFPTRLGGTTIDLAFVSGELADRALSCSVYDQLDLGSDHRPILTRLLAEPAPSPARETRVWKKANMDEARAEAARTLEEREILSKDELDRFATELSEAIDRIIQSTVPVRRPSPYASPWWNDEVALAVWAARRARTAWYGSRSDAHWALGGVHAA